LSQSRSGWHTEKNVSQYSPVLQLLPPQVLCAAVVEPPVAADPPEVGPDPELLEPPELAAFAVPELAALAALELEAGFPVDPLPADPKPVTEVERHPPDARNARATRWRMARG
jgi:hypothetical protein